MMPMGSGIKALSKLRLALAKRAAIRIKSLPVNVWPLGKAGVSWSFYAPHF